MYQYGETVAETAAEISTCPKRLSTPDFLKKRPHGRNGESPYPNNWPISDMAIYYFLIIKQHG
jgi:hypothetical protein